MKHTGIKRFFSAALTVVLAVGLMPLPAFAETVSGQQEETLLAAAGFAAHASRPMLTTQRYYGDAKGITGLGVTSIDKPTHGNGGWSKVYFGGIGDSDGEPLLFNVLNPHETCFGGDTMFLDCSTTVRRMWPYVRNGEYFNTNIHKYLNGEFLQQRFTGAEQDAIAVSVKEEEAPGDGRGYIDTNDATLSPFRPIRASDNARIFALDAREATNESYGFANSGKENPASTTRQKRGANENWWTRSGHVANSSWHTIIQDDGKFSYGYWTNIDPENFGYGVSPCLNVKLSSILYTSKVDLPEADDYTFKLTVRDNSLRLNAGDAVKDLSWVTVPYTVTGNYNQLSVLLTEAEWTDSGWDDPTKDFVYVEADERVSTWTDYSTSGQCTFSSSLLLGHPDWNVYLVAELASGYDYETDYASAPVKLTPKQHISRIASGYTGTYDGEAHGITIRTGQPSWATIKYGTAPGVYDLDESPTITDVKDSPFTVYYQMTADGYFTLTSSETVTILPANPEIPPRVTAHSGQTLDGVPLPECWSWDNATTNVGGLGARTFSASYKSKDPNYRDMSHVDIPVTVVESTGPDFHQWGDASYAWNADNRSVTATHHCAICGIDEMETVSTRSIITKQPTCSSKGETTYTATFSKEGFTEQSKSIENINADPEAHEWGGWIVTKYPTCTEAGTEIRFCAHDKAHTESRMTSARGHEWKELVSYVEGEEHYAYKRWCEVCGEKIEWWEQSRDHHHELGLIEGVNATCESPGTKEHYQCITCMRLFSDMSGNEEWSDSQVWTVPLGHKLGAWRQSKKPTCSAEGEWERTCSHDGCDYKEMCAVAIDPDAHNWGAWTVIKAATVAQEGVEQRVCKDDASHVETRAIPKIDPAKSDAPAKTSIAKAKVTLAQTSYTCNGKAKKPAVKSVVLDGKTLKAGTDYTVKYSNNKKPGKATVTVTGEGAYTDSAKATFKIKLGKAKISTVGNAGEKAKKISWKKVKGAKKYQLQYRQAGGKWKTVTVKGASKTVKKLKAGKLYQFRVRAVAGDQKGKWSKVFSSSA